MTGKRVSHLALESTSWIMSDTMWEITWCHWGVELHTSEKNMSRVLGYLEWACTGNEACMNGATPCIIPSRLDIEPYSMWLKIVWHHTCTYKPKSIQVCTVTILLECQGSTIQKCLLLCTSYQFDLMFYWPMWTVKLEEAFFYGVKCCKELWPELLNWYINLQVFAEIPLNFR